MPIRKNQARIIPLQKKIKTKKPTASLLNKKTAQQLLSSQKISPNTINIILSKNKIPREQAIFIFKNLKPNQKKAILKLYDLVDKYYSSKGTSFNLPNLEEIVQLNTISNYANAK